MDWIAPNVNLSEVIFSIYRLSGLFLLEMNSLIDSLHSDGINALNDA